MDKSKQKTEFKKQLFIKQTPIIVKSVRTKLISAWLIAIFTEELA